MSDPFATNRRCFVKAVAAAGAGLALGFEFAAGASPERRGPKETAGFRPNAYLRIAPDGVVTVTVTRTEIGQGVRTSLPMIVAEELEADWSRIVVEQASPNAAFRSLGTGGSWSIGGNWRALRTAGATARQMLVSAAAHTWGVPPATCRAHAGSVVHAPSGRALSYGFLAPLAATLPVPTDVEFKDPSAYTILGTRVPRVDATSIVTGRARYGIDARVDGMRHAAVVRAPALGAEPVSWNAVRTLAVPGVVSVTRISTGVAVVAESTWSALKGAEALDVRWSDGPNRDFDSARFVETLARAARERGVSMRTEGDGIAALGKAARTLEADYVYPFQAHAPVEPMNCLASAAPDSCELWAPTQAPDRVRERVAERLALTPDKVTVNVTLAGGGFGRRLNWDYAVEAAELSRAIKAPVQVLWSRQDDMRHGHFQPASVHRLAGGLDENGAIVAWSHTKAGSFLSMSGLPTAEERKDPELYRGSAWGAYDIPYSIPSIETSYVAVDSPVPSGPWRSVFSPSSTFARECFFDELAHAAGRDPLRARLELLEPGRKVTAGGLTLDQGRLRRVLELAAERAGWTGPVAKGRGRGLACNIYDGDTCLAYVVEVSVDERGRVRVHRVVCAVDCGIVVNPSGVEAQIEGGVAFGLSTTLHGQITIKSGRIEQSNYLDYPVVRMGDAPDVEVHVVPSTASPTGMGEPPVPPIAPAVANAIFAATGRRIRRLPIRPEDLRTAPA